MHQFSRQQQLLEFIQRRGEATIAMLVDALHSSPATVRRDLAELEKSGDILRTHGGAIDPRSISAEQNFPQKEASASEEKNRIALKVLETIPDGASVFIDAGTTCLQAGIGLLRRGKNRLITNSIPLLMAGCNFPGAVVAVGGEVRSVSRALVGSFGIEWIQRLHFDIALLGASAIGNTGKLFTTELQEAHIKKEAAKKADRIFLLADRHKMAAKATVCFLTLAECDEWFADSNLAPSVVRKLKRTCKVQIHRC